MPHPEVPTRQERHPAQKARMRLHSAVSILCTKTPKANQSAPESRRSTLDRLRLPVAMLHSAPGCHFPPAPDRKQRFPQSRGAPEVKLCPPNTHTHTPRPAPRLLRRPAPRTPSPVPAAAVRGCSSVGIPAPAATGCPPPPMRMRGARSAHSRSTCRVLAAAPRGSLKGRSSREQVQVREWRGEAAVSLPTDHPA
jgi:hypothetical protein